MKNILQKLEEITAKNPQKVLFAEKKGNEVNEITYSDFVLKSKAVASALKALENRNQPIAVFDNRNINTLIGMFGVLYSGNYYVILDSHSPTERLSKITNILKPVAYIFEDCNNDLLNQLKSEKRQDDLSRINDKVLNDFCFNINEIKSAIIDVDFIDLRRHLMISTDPIYALFTSGSTGMPKGTILTHQNVLNYAEWFATTFSINETTIIGNQTPFYFSMSVSDIYGCIYGGATLNIIPKSFFSFPIQLVQFMNERKINTIYWVPSALSIVANLKLFDYAKPEYLSKVLFAGEPMPNKQLNYWRKNLNSNIMYANLFGPTETTDICTYYVVNREFSDDESLPIGRHCDNCDTFILDESGNAVKKAGGGGELYVRGSFVALGYFDNEEKTQSTFVQNPLQSHYPEIVYKTGDLVKLNEYGEYIYMGRKDFQIKHMGYRIELGEIETMASSLEKVNIVVCIYDAEIDNIVLIYEGKIKETELIEALKAKVPPYMVPNKVIKTNQMPYNANGKIDRASLKTNYKSLIKE